AAGGGGGGAGWVGGGGGGAGENRRNRIGTEIELAAAQHAAHADRMQVAADDERRASLHGRDRRHQAVVLLQPARLPIGLWLVHRQLTVAPEDVRVPFAPLAGRPAGRLGRHVPDVRHVGRGRALLGQWLDLGSELDGAGAG